LRAKTILRQLRSDFSPSQCMIMTACMDRVVRSIAMYALTTQLRIFVRFGGN
jgi:hypothetical protein